MTEFIRKYKSYGLYFFIYLPLGCLAPFIGQYLTSIGFSGTQIGVVTASAMGAAVIGGLVWGRVYANSRRKKFLISIMLMMAAFGAVTSLFIKTFLLYGVVYSCIYFFQMPTYGFCDSMMIENGENFPAVRAMGAIGYGVAVYLVGAAAESLGLEIIFYAHGVTALISIGILQKEKEPLYYIDEETSRDSEKKVGLRELFFHRDFVSLLVFSFFLLGTTVANNTYFGYLYTEGGGTIKGIGVAFFLMAGSEAIFMFLIPKLNGTFSTEKLILFGTTLAVARFGLYSIGLPYWVLLGTFFVQGMMNGLILVEIVKYFEKIVPSKLSSISVATYYALGCNLSAIMCSIIGGIILDQFGPKGVYLFFTILCTIALLLYVTLKLHIEKSKVEH